MVRIWSRGPVNLWYNHVQNKNFFNSTNLFPPWNRCKWTTRLLFPSSFKWSSYAIVYTMPRPWEVRGYLVSRAAVGRDRQTGNAWDNRLTRRTVREYRPNLEISIHFLVVDAWPLISSASATFLHNLRTLVLHIFGRAHFSNCRRTAWSVGNSDRRDQTLRFPFWQRRHRWEPDCPYLLFPLRFLVIGVLLISLRSSPDQYNMRASLASPLSLRGWIVINLAESGVLGDPEEYSEP